MAIITLTSQNQRASMPCPSKRRRRRGRRMVGGGAVRDLAHDQVQEQAAEHDVDAGEPQQGEDRLAAVHQVAGAVAGAHEPVDEPRLASQLRGHPARRGGDVGEGKGQHQNPQQPARLVEPPAPDEIRRQHHERDEDGPEPHHDVEAVVEELDVGRPVLARELRQPLHVAVERAVGDEAQDARACGWGCRGAGWPRRAGR